MKNLISLIIVLIVGVNLFSQEIEFLKTPLFFSDYQSSILLKGFSQNTMSLEEYCNDKFIEKDWVVFSDRNDNELYFGRNDVTNGSFLSFLEPLKVKEVEGNWLHVYSHHKNNNKCLERGWIHAKYLVLSRFSLLNKQRIQKKAMILVSVDQLITGSKNASEIISKNFYNKPSADRKNTTGNKAKKFKIYFILKEEKGSVLLSQADNLKHNNLEQLRADVPGWMPKGAITPWDHRVCLESNSKLSAVQDYSSNDIPVFHSKDSLAFFLESQIYLKNNVIKKYTLSNERQLATEMRMPVLENYSSKNDIKKVASIARIGTTDTREKDKDQAKVKQLISEISDKMESVDILFVVDATQSMSKYYESIAKSIEQIIKSQQGSSYKLRFALSIYRDYPDGKGKDYELYPLTRDDKSIIQAVNQVQCFSSDNDAPEAQFKGLINGINECGFSKGKSNVVILVGDAGNHEDDLKYNLKGVNEALYSKEASFISFQVHKGEDFTYTNFNLDVQQMLRKTAHKYVTGTKDVKLEKSTDGNTYRLRFVQDEGNENLYMFGRYTYASGNKNPMPTSILEVNIEEAIDEYIERASMIKAKLEEARSGKESVFTYEFINLLKRRGLSDSQIEILKKEKEITAIGYTSMKMYGKATFCYAPVVFLSESEKERISDVLSILVNKTKSTTQQKKAFQEALLTQCSEMLGQNSVPEDITLNEVWETILGIPFEGDRTIGNRKLREMDQIEDIEFDDFFEPFKDKADRFVMSDFNDSKFELSDVLYYWIPLNAFPGNE